VKPRHLYWRLFAEARPFVPHVVGLLLLSALSAVLTLLIPLPLKIAVDSAIGSHPLPDPLGSLLPSAVSSSDNGVLIVAVVLLVGVMLLKQVQEFASLVLSTYAGQKLLLSFRARLFHHVQRLSLAYHDTKGVTDSTYRIQYDAQALQTLVIASLIPFLTAAFTVAGMLYVTMMIDWRLGLIALAVTPPLLVTFYLYRRRLRRQWHEAKRLESSALSVVQEALSALRVVKAFGQEDRERKRFVGRSGESMRVQVGLSFVEGAFGVLIGLIVALGMAAVLFVGTRSVEAGVLTVGELVLVMAYLQQLYEPLQTISKKAGTLQSSLASAERVFALLDETPDLVESPRARPLRRARGAVAFERVSFAYDGEQPVLRDVSFQLEPGTSAGIAGATGAGKTTLVSLLTRFYDPTSGRIALDGVDLRDYRLVDLRNQFAIVLQEPVLFSTSVAENIAYARPGARRREIEAAARAADAHDFIAELPDGYETPVGERGMRLSGGERQRISLARAFLKDAPLLVLDEPTSSVDVHTEATIMAAMERLMAGRTTIMIAHRLSTLEDCDVRLEIEDGRLIHPPREWRPPAGVVELARRAVEDGAGQARLVSQRRLKRSVHRLCFDGAASKPVIAKLLSPPRARLNRLVAERWLPAAGLGWACPRPRGSLADPEGRGTWQLYDDLGGRPFDYGGCESREVEPVVELLAELHARFAAHTMLDEARQAGEDLGMKFFDREVDRCIRILESLGSTGRLGKERAGLRERLLERMRRLRSSRDERALALRDDGGPETLLHGDLWPANVLVLERGSGVEARLIDWDHAGTGPLTYDLSTLLYRLPLQRRPGVLAAYRKATERRGLQLPPDQSLELLFDTAECARYACCLAGAAKDAADGKRWGFEQMAEIETWFAGLEPVLAASLG
jgi:ATP-binding cassette, subfamily B, bacterial